MTETPANQGQGCPSESAQLRPSFWRAFQGLWLFTWKPQLTWKRMLVGSLTLLVLPFLVLITVLPADAWSRQHSLLGNADRQLRDLDRRFAREKLAFQPNQRVEIRRILEEEYARSEEDLSKTPFSVTGISQMKRQIRLCYGRIRERAKKVLDDCQMPVYERFEMRRLEDGQARAGQTRWSRTGAFCHWLIDFYFFVLLPLNCVRVCGPLIRDELQANTLGFLTTRPLSRAGLVLAKYLSLALWLQVLLLIQTLLLFGVGFIRDIDGLGRLLPLFLGSQILAVLAWSALGAFLGLVTNRYMAIAILYGLIVELGIGRIPTNINNLSLVRHLKILLGGDPTVNDVYNWAGTGVPLAVGALVFAAVIFATFAALLFTYREYHHTTEMQK